MGMTLAAGHYLTWGVVTISVANLVIVGVMMAVFVLALLIPFGSEQGAEADRPAPHDGPEQ